MAELNRQGSIKLSKKYQFRISVIATARSFSTRQTSRHKKSAKIQKSKNNQQHKSQNQKYPQFSLFKRALEKIGAIQRQDFNFFQPEQKDQKEFISKRKAIMKKKLFQSVNIQQQQLPFQDQLDQAALGCWKYGQNNGVNTVWKRYRQNLDDLSYFTLKVTSKKKIH